MPHPGGLFYRSVSVRAFGVATPKRSLVCASLRSSITIIREPAQVSGGRFVQMESAQVVVSPA
jgi:hypothetical protein